MGFIHDAIMESNKMEEQDRFQKVKNSSQLKGKKKKKTECSKEVTEGVVSNAIEKVGKVADKVSNVCDALTEEDKLEEAMVDIEKYLDNDNYLNKDTYTEELHPEEAEEQLSFELPDRYMKGRPGSPEYDANDNRRKREALYRSIVNIDEDFEITEDNIKDWAVSRVCSDFRCGPDKVKAELLKKPYTGLERYDED